MADQVFQELKKILLDDHNIDEYYKESYFTQDEWLSRDIPLVYAKIGGDPTMIIDLQTLRIDEILDQTLRFTLTDIIQDYQVLRELHKNKELVSHYYCIMESDHFYYIIKKCIDVNDIEILLIFYKFT